MLSGLCGHGSSPPERAPPKSALQCLSVALELGEGLAGCKGSSAGRRSSSWALRYLAYLDDGGRSVALVFIGLFIFYFKTRERVRVYSELYEWLASSVQTLSNRIV